MKLTISDKGGVISPELMEPITRRLEHICARAGLKEVVVNVERRVSSGKAGTTVGPLGDNVALPFSVQCGKGGDKFRGTITSPQAHVAQILADLAKVSDPSLKVLTGAGRGLKKKHSVAKVKKTTLPKPEDEEVVSSSVLQLNKPKVLRMVILALMKVSSPMSAGNMISAVLQDLRLKYPPNHLLFMFRFLIRKRMIKQVSKSPKTYELTKQAQDFVVASAPALPEKTQLTQMAPVAVVKPQAAMSGLQQKIAELEKAESEQGRLVGEINEIKQLLDMVKERLGEYEAAFKRLQKPLVVLARLRKELGVKETQSTK